MNIPVAVSSAAFFLPFVVGLAVLAVDLTAEDASGSTGFVSETSSPPSVLSKIINIHIMFRLLQDPSQYAPYLSLFHVPLASLEQPFPTPPPFWC